MVEAEGIEFLMHRVELKVFKHIHINSCYSLMFLMHRVELKGRNASNGTSTTEEFLMHRVELKVFLGVFLAKIFPSS